MRLHIVLNDLDRYKDQETNVDPRDNTLRSSIMILQCNVKRTGKEEYVMLF